MQEYIKKKMCTNKWGERGEVWDEGAPKVGSCLVFGVSKVKWVQKVGLILKSVYHLMI